MTKRKENRVSASKSLAPTRPLPPPGSRYVLRLFWQQDTKLNTETITSNGSSFSSSLLSPATPTSEVTRSELHRIVFFNSDKTTEDPLLVLDVHPSSTVRLSATALKLQIQILTPFAAIGKRLKLEAEIEIDNVGSVTRPVFKRLLAVNRPGPGLLPTNLMQNVSGSAEDRLKKLLALPSPQIPPLPHSGLPTGSGFDDDFLRRITGISIPNFAPPSCNTVPQKTEFSFVRLPGRVGPLATVKTLQLQLSSAGKTKCAPSPSDRGRLRTFWGSDDDRFEYSRSAAPDQWLFIQRPSSAIDVTKPASVGPTPRAHWILQVFGIPTRPALQTWNRLAAEFQLAISRSRGGHSVSFLPKFIEDSPDIFNPDGSDVFGRWGMSYELKDSNSSTQADFFPSSDSEPPIDVIAIRPLSLHLWRRPVERKLQAVLDQIKNVDNLSLERLFFIVKPIDSTEFDLTSERRKGMYLDCSAAVTVTPKGGTRPLVRMGSLDLRFGATTEAQVGSSQTSLRIRPKDEIFEVDSSYHLAVEEIAPGGQDYAVSEEYDDSLQEDELRPCVRPKPPIVIPLGPIGSATPSKKLLLLARERLTDHHRILLEIISQAGSATRDPLTNVCQAADRAVVVLDRNPFLVAEVKYLSFDRVTPFGASVVARWDSDDGIAGAWQLQLEERPFCLVLPPQAVGEEMIKDQNLGQSPRALPFNLGSATTFELNPRRVRSDFAEAPWNLRRILALQAQPEPGPSVKSIHYELLYGLSADAKNPGIRLADTFSQAGRTMPLPRKDMAWSHTDEQEGLYQANRKTWAKLYHRLLSRLAVLVPWDELLPTSEHRSVVLSESVSSRLRLPPWSNLKSPVDMSGETPVPADGTLRGGATWGFESKNIYKAVIKNPDSSSSKLENFAFSSLGGWGRQEAGFQNDLTKISAEVAMGRAYHYQVERLGRIACTWHLAKHVIVYERSVVPSRQFNNPNQQLLGWPVIRKVREYVQILEPKRSYPDGAEQNSNQVNGGKQSRGFLDSCEFKAAAEFNVNGSWGSDVGDYGWKIPLWRVGAQPEDIYPKPKVQFGLDCNQGEQQKVNQCDLDNPENLYFFTLTRDPKDPTKEKKPDPDPRKWDPVVDIDFVNKPRPKASLADFNNGDPRALSPLDPAVPLHYGPCTFRLVPSAIPADIVSQRAGKAMAAVVDTITIARSAVSGGASNWPPKELKDVDAFHENIDTLYRGLLSKLPLDGGPSAELVSKLSQAVQADISSFQTKFNLATQQVDLLKAQLTQRIKDAEVGINSINSRFNQRLSKLVNEAVSELLERVSAYVLHDPFDKDVALGILKETQHRVEEILLLSSSLPGVVPDLMARYVDVVLNLQSTLDSELTKIRRSLDSPFPVPAAQLNAAVAEVTALVERARGIAQSFNTAGLTPPLPFIPDPGPRVRVLLNKYSMVLKEPAII